MVNKQSIILGLCIAVLAGCSTKQVEPEAKVVPEENVIPAMTEAEAEEATEDLVETVESADGTTEAIDSALQALDADLEQIEVPEASELDDLE